MKKQKKSAILLLAVLVVFQVSIFSLYPNEVRAVPAEVTADAPRSFSEDSARVGKSIYASALGALVQGASHFMRKLAYDTATYIASGGKGQSPLAFNTDIGVYVKEQFMNSIADSIGAFGEPYGLNLCKPPNPKVQINIQIALRRLYAPDGTGGDGPKPRCTWQELKSNYENGNSQDLTVGNAAKFANSLDVGQTDFGIALGAMAQLDRLEATTKDTSIARRLEQSGFKPVNDLISGNIKTPAKVVEEENKKLGTTHASQQTMSQISGIYAASAEQIFPMAASVFLNTLTGKLLDKIFKIGLFPSSDKKSTLLGNEYTDPYSGSFNDNRQAAQRAFNFLFTDVPQQLQNYDYDDLISEFSACPSNPGINNCVIDPGFQNVITQGRPGGTAMTIREAIDKDMLHRSWALVSPKRKIQHEDPRCASEAYCYSNLQKLRRIRIIPLGFEIAALRSDPDVPWKLGDVVDNFENCIPGNPGSEYCHLIDPNWIIKIPEVRCESRVFGPELLSPDTPRRREECVDISTRIIEAGHASVNTGGQADSGFGYCLQEKNVWDIPGTACPSYFNTCRSYTGTDKKIVSYLSRTVDVGQCTIDTVGCRAYSTRPSGDGWLPSVNADQTVEVKQTGRSDTLYFNQRVGDISSDCGSSNADGCSAFYGLTKQIDGTFEQTSSNVLHLQKAPEYLGCYDTNRSANSPEINWPETVPDLANLPSDSQCGNYAQACLPSEVGCDQFTPVIGGGEPIPGIIGNNACPGACVGYDTFKQQGYRDAGQGFEGEVYPLQFIPSNAKSCNSTNVGCDEFTNIEASTSGGEQLSYFSKLKYCEKPEGDNKKVFYSWEGSASQGYVLKTHELLRIDSTDAEYIGGLGLTLNSGDTALSEFGVGSPAYADTSKSEIQRLYGACNEQNYTLGLSNPEDPDGARADCRALYDNDGAVFYRMMSRSVTVSPQCQRLRKTTSNLEIDASISTKSMCEKQGGLFTVVDESGTCQRCSSGGIYENGACVYQTIPSEASSCPASANQCRFYVGNKGNNVQKVISETFDPASTSDNALLLAKEGWNGVPAPSVRPESVQVGQYSLMVDANTLMYTVPAGTINPHDSYELSFWARGISQNLQIFFLQNAQIKGMFTPDSTTQSQLSSVSVGNGWKQYRIGPVHFSGDPSAPTTLVFNRTLLSGTSGVYFLDTVELFAFEDSFALIKNSWKTAEGYDAPLSCDANPIDGLPGEFLGCRAYLDTKGTEHQVIGFAGLCRQEAIGCTALIDTQNTVDGGDASWTQVFNVQCLLSDVVSEPTACQLTNGVNGTELGNCTVKIGQQGCTIPKISLDPEGEMNIERLEELRGITASTIIIPADNTASTPIFLTNRPEFVCAEKYRGCRAVGLEDKTFASNEVSSFAYTNVSVKNDPDRYVGTDGILCQSDTVGCDAFASDSGTSYFKDPTVVGNKVCTYKPLAPSANSGGWFLDGVGTCTGATTQQCRTDADCPISDSCDKNSIGAIACYPNYLEQGNMYGIRSNQSAGYQGYVGTCSPEFNQCTELVDVADTSQNSAGTSYFVVYNNQVTDRIRDCLGKVSLKEGCVLFNNTNNPNKIYNSVVTYSASEGLENNRYGAVDADTSATRDTNVILKVTRDRACSEWLGCKSQISVTRDNGTTAQLCYEYDACTASDNGIDCTEWTESTPRTADGLPARLTYDAYIQRGTSWFDPEFSGYSLYDSYQIPDLVYVTVPGSSVSFLAYELEKKYTQASSNFGCASKNDWDICGFDQGGRCFEKKCLYPVDGAFPATAITKELALPYLEGGTCKAFPEQDSPFPLALVKDAKTLKGTRGGVDVMRKDFITKAPGFEGANVCQDGNCSCEYTKISYKNGGGTDYWPIEQSGSYPVGVCNGGTETGAPCQSDNDCGAGGTCSGIESLSTHIGLTGYCLEYDLSRPLNAEKGSYACSTWLPIDVSASHIDPYNNDPKTGYYPQIDAVTQSETGKDIIAGQVYCTDSTGGGEGTYREDMMSVPVGGGDHTGPGSYLSFGSDEVKNKSIQNIYDTYFLPLRIFDTHANDGSTYTSDSILYSGPWLCNMVLDYPGICQKLLYSVATMSLWNETVGGTKYAEPNGFVAHVIDPQIMYKFFYDGTDTFSLPFPSLPRPIYENEISKIRYAPFITSFSKAYTDIGFLEFDTEVVRLDSATPHVAIDFEELKVCNNSFDLPSGQKICYTSAHLKNFTNEDYDIYTYKGIDEKTNKMRYGIHIFFDDDWYNDLRDNPKKSRLEFAKAHISASFVPDDIAATELTGLRGADHVWVWIDFDGDVNSTNPNKRKLTRYTQWGAEGFNEDEDHPDNLYGRTVSQSSFPALATSIVLKSSCTQFDVVYDNTENKAWTQRLWNYAQNQNVLGESFPLSKLVGREFVNTPYGSLPLTSADMMTQMKYSFSNAMIDGIPYACTEKMFFNADWRDTGIPVVPSDAQCSGLVYGFGYGTSLRKDLYTTERGNTDVSGVSLLRKLFASTVSRWLRNAEETFTNQNINEPLDDSYTLGLTNGLPPQIYSINPATCLGILPGGAGCSIGEAYNMTINDKTGVSQDYDGDGQVDTEFSEPVFGRGNVVATMRFFGWADDNRMPLRRVMVDWTDDSAVLNASQDGRYKNRKPYCSQSDNESTPSIGLCAGTSLTCKTNAECASLPNTSQQCVLDYPDPRFGNAPRACEAGYFEFTHSYGCDSADAKTVTNWGTSLSTADRAFLATKNVRPNDSVCVYQPRVQLRDNWGWCNGVEDTTNKVPNGYSEVFLRASTTEDHCDPFDPASGDLPWTYYRGKIIVAL